MPPLERAILQFNEGIKPMSICGCYLDCNVCEFYLDGSTRVHISIVPQKRRQEIIKVATKTESINSGREAKWASSHNKKKKQKNKNIHHYYSMMMKHKANIAMVFVQIVYAGMPLLSKVAISQGTNPFVFVFYRQAFAVVALSPFAFFLDRFFSFYLSISSL